MDSLLKSVSDDGRIHTTFFQTVAATGRLSSTDPNLQNVPIRTEEGRRIRRAFVVGRDYDSLLTADYSQIEMRIMADLSHDDALIEAFRSGADFHAATASTVFSMPLAAIGPEHRRRVKAMNYGLAYGLSAFGLSGSSASRPTRPRSSWRGTSTGSVGSATTFARSWPRPDSTGTPRLCSGAAATYRISPATTGSAARWLSGWRSTRRSRARRPTSSRSPCCGWTRRCARRSSHRGCSCRCTTSWCSRWLRGAGPARGAHPAGDGQRLPA